jgi:hypothetical protein
LASDNVFAVEEDTHSGGVLGDPLVRGLVPLGILRVERRGRGGGREKEEFINSVLHSQQSSQNRKEKRGDRKTFIYRLHFFSVPVTPKVG